MSDQEKIRLLVNALEEDINIIKQLFDMVNAYSIKLGLGLKVGRHVEDWIENAINAIAKVNG